MTKTLMLKRYLKTLNKIIIYESGIKQYFHIKIWKPHLYMGLFQMCLCNLIAILNIVNRNITISCVSLKCYLSAQLFLLVFCQGNWASPYIQGCLLFGHIRCLLNSLGSMVWLLVQVKSCIRNAFCSLATTGL